VKSERDRRGLSVWGIAAQGERSFTSQIYTHLYDQQRKQAAVDLFKNAKNKSMDGEQKELNLEKNQG